jgi:uncharacterized protein DUF3108
MNPALQCSRRGSRAGFAAAVFAAAIAPLAAAAAPPQRVTVYYDLSYNGVVMAEGHETLQHDARTYLVESQARGKGVFAMIKRGEVRRSSRGEVTPGGLRPLEFKDQRGDRDPEFARFDWGARLVTHEREGGKQTSTIGEGSEDRLSFMWNFAFAPPKGEVSAQVVDGRGTTHFRYALAGRQTLKTQAGEMDCLHLVKLKDKGDERDTEIWLAVQRSYIPVRLLVVEKDGTRVDQVVTRIEP